MLPWLDAARSKRWINVCVVNLRILLGFAFLPAGLKKVLDEPFTDPQNTGVFHEFLDAFHATGLFYQFVGGVQLCVAALLLTQTLPTLGAALALPLFAAIAVFCWSTGAVFTAFMVTLMLAGAAALVIWDFDRWREVIGAPPRAPRERVKPPIDIALWRRCGAAILVLYLGITAMSGGVYRPEGVELGDPAFWTLPLIATLPIVTLVVEQMRRRRAVSR